MRRRGRIVGDGGGIGAPDGERAIAHGALGVEVKAGHHAIVQFDHRKLDVIAQAEVQRQPVVDLPVVLEKAGHVGLLAIERVVPIDVGVVHGAEQQRRHGIAVEGALRTARELLRPAGVEAHQAGGTARALIATMNRSPFHAVLQRVAALGLGQAGLEVHLLALVGIQIIIAENAVEAAQVEAGRQL